ncbi:MAG: CDP-glycerol glycerophosphotransferase family protein [Sulfurovum sp.]|nr:CDP-glycerol glycerophosphotransferase family protein [Sulfurovum sp.]
MKKYIRYVMSILENIMHTKENLICVRALPNFSDEVYWISEYVKENNLKLVILYDKSDRVPKWAKKNHIRCIQYKSIQGLFFYLKAKVIIYTHGIYSFLGKKNNGLIVNIWHGMPLKNIGTYKNVPKDELPKFDIILADREEFISVMAKAFAVDECSVIALPSPRIDSLVNNSIIKTKNNIELLWLPTFRSSYTGIDGDFSKLPFLSDIQLSILSSKLEEYNALCYIKPHPLSKDDFSKIGKYKNIILLGDFHDDIEKSLYTIVRECDIVITDYSSIMFDLDHVEKEVVLYTPDLREYKQSVGFIDSVLADVEAKFIIDFEEFLNCLEMEMKKLKYNSMHNKVSTLKRGYWTNQMFQKLHKIMEVS